MKKGTSTAAAAPTAAPAAQPLAVQPTVAAPAAGVGNLMSMFDFAPSSGLPTGFWGRVAQMVFCPRRIMSGPQEGKHVLSVRCTIAVDPNFIEHCGGKDSVVAYLSCGGTSLKRSVPSLDGVNPAGGAFEPFRLLLDGEATMEPGDEDRLSGPYAIVAPWNQDNSEKRNQLPDKTVWVQWVHALLQLGFVPPANARGCDFAIGAHCRFDRVPFKMEGNFADSGKGDSKGPGDVLVPTELDKSGVSSPAAAPVTVATAAQPTTAQPVAVAAAQPAPSPVAATAPTPTGNIDLAALDNNILTVLIGKPPMLIKDFKAAVLGLVGANGQKLYQGADMATVHQLLGNEQFLDNSKVLSWDAAAGTVEAA